MKSILFIFSFCLFVRLQIDGTGKQLTDLIEFALEGHGQAVLTVFDAAKSNETINDVLQPLENGLLGSGGGGFVFRGLRLQDSRPVAIKFVSNATKAGREYATYSYLKAINCTNAENYGIPTVYYYGRWNNNNLMVTAYTQHDETLLQRKEYLQCSDYLILFRHFIKQTKYIHSRGIRHDDVKPDNIVFRDCETFLIDFDYASKMKEDNGGRTPSLASLRHHNNQQRVNMDDWESFLYTLCVMLEIKLEELLPKVRKPVKNIDEAIFELWGDLKKMRTEILAKITKKLEVEYPILKYVMESLAIEVFSGKEIPNYDRFDFIVSERLRIYFGGQKCFSWITSDCNQKRIRESIKRANTRIDDLVMPNYEVYRYPDVDPDFFNNH